MTYGEFMEMDENQKLAAIYDLIHTPTARANSSRSMVFDLMTYLFSRFVEVVPAEDGEETEFVVKQPIVAKTKTDYDMDKYKREVQDKADAAERYARLQTKWGKKYKSEGKYIEYSPMELDELENYFNMQAAEYKGVITERIRMALMEISYNRLEWKKSTDIGDSQAAKRYGDMITGIMTREGLRAIDGKAAETPKTDGIIAGMEKFGLAADGVIVPPDVLIEKMADALMRKYNTSMDAVDEMTFCILNTMAANNGTPKFSLLPLSAQIKDRGKQLRRELTDREAQANADLGIMPPLKEESDDDTDGGE